MTFLPYWHCLAFYVLCAILAPTGIWHSHNFFYRFHLALRTIINQYSKKLTEKNTNSFFDATWQNFENFQKPNSSISERKLKNQLYTTLSYSKFKINFGLQKTDSKSRQKKIVWSDLRNLNPKRGFWKPRSLTFVYKLHFPSLQGCVIHKSWLINWNHSKLRIKMHSH